MHEPRQLCLAAAEALTYALCVRSQLQVPPHHPVVQGQCSFNDAWTYRPGSRIGAATDSDASTMLRVTDTTDSQLPAYRKQAHLGRMLYLRPSAPWPNHILRALQAENGGQEVWTCVTVRARVKGCTA